MNQNIEKIAIVGGGTAGWITAACLARVLPKQFCSVVLVEAPDIDTVGVGEATIPPIVDFIRFLGIDTKDFLKKTNATHKLAIHFQDWFRLGESYWHPFGAVGANINKAPFFPYWLKCWKNKKAEDYTQYSAAVHMASAGRFAFPESFSTGFITGASYAWHFDAALVAQYLREYALRLGVQRIEARVENVELDCEGAVQNLRLQDNSRLDADFFIDCTGFRAALIGKSLSVPFIDWSHYLPCDSAIAIQTQTLAETKPYTIARALRHGWQWQIPLQNRIGNGYVYSRRFCDPEQALIELRANLPAQEHSEPRYLSFKAGHRERFWEKNCLSIGLASGFLEPLESTSIHLIMRAVKLFIELFPNRAIQSANVAEYNRLMHQEYEAIRDFLLLHYCTTKRDDSEFWRQCQSAPIPESLRAKMDLYTQQGRLYKNEHDLFKSFSWYSVFTGMHVYPQDYDPLSDLVPSAELENIMVSLTKTVREEIKALPGYDRFLADHLSD